MKRGAYTPVPGRMGTGAASFADTRRAPSTLHVGPVADHRDWPVIAARHPSWWRVYRVELRRSRFVRVLIAECEDEQRALDVARLQRSQCVITRRGDRRAPYVTSRAPRVVGGPRPGGGDEVVRRDA